MFWLIWLFVALPFGTYGYFSDGGKEAYFSDHILQDFVNRIGKELVESSDSIDSFDDKPVRFSLMTDTLNNMDMDTSDDYELHGNVENVWDKDTIGKLPSRPRVKNEVTLPAYCNPPNPCPVGYTEDQKCQTDFENTSTFSRDYQAAQECMCDNEHMFDCPTKQTGDDLLDPNFTSMLVRELQLTKYKGLMAKKFQPFKDENPYLDGEKLPIAAKKGNQAY